MLDRHECFPVFHNLQKDKQQKQRHSLKLGKKKRESSKRNYYIISPRVIIKAIIIIVMFGTTCPVLMKSWGFHAPLTHHLVPGGKRIEQTLNLFCTNEVLGFSRTTDAAPRTRRQNNRTNPVDGL